VTWPQIHHFEMRGYRGGLGLWTVDGDWIRLLPYGAFDATARTALTRLEQYRWQQQQGPA
jgi:hypothetical protein